MLTLSKIDRAEEDQITLKPFEYIHKEPSKYHRLVVQVFDHWLQAPKDKVKEIEEIFHVTHTLTLILDDIQDNSMFRYSLPVAHHVFGLGLTVNAATRILGIAVKKVLGLNHPKAIDIYLTGYDEAHRGQGMEIHWRDNFQCPTEEEYIEILKQSTNVLLKTAFNKTIFNKYMDLNQFQGESSSMIIMVLRLLQLFSKSKEDHLQVAVLFGVYYSIRDDYCNLFNRKSLRKLSDNHIDDGISGDSDITEGKFTLPIIHAIKNSDAAQEIIDILKQRTMDPKLINYCISLIKMQASDKYTGEILKKLERDIEKEIPRLGSNPKFTSMMKELRNWRTSGEE